jgi:hypothetical protein
VNSYEHEQQCHPCKHEESRSFAAGQNYRSNEQQRVGYVGKNDVKHPVFEHWLVSFLTPRAKSDD